MEETRQKEEASEGDGERDAPHSNARNIGPRSDQRGRDPNRSEEEEPAEGAEAAFVSGGQGLVKIVPSGCDADFDGHGPPYDRGGETSRVVLRTASMRSKRPFEAPQLR